MSTKASNSAFPRVCGYSEVEGMTLREYYIGQALTGLLANGNFAPADSAEWAIKVANILMEKLNK